LFELDTSVQINRLKRQLKEQIEIIEPRVTNVGVRFAPVTNSNRLDVTVTYSIINGKRNNQVEFSVSRVR
jgi:predicted component of type VI protein secretion system